MSLPRFDFLDEEHDDDSTAPAQFVLKLPPSYVRKLESLQQQRQQSMVWPTPSAPWTVETTAPPREPKKLVAIFASVAAALVLAVGIGGAVAHTASDGPIGVSKRAPKSLEHVVRASARQSGTVTVSIESLQRAHHHARRHR